MLRRLFLMILLACQCHMLAQEKDPLQVRLRLAPETTKIADSLGIQEGSLKVFRSDGTVLDPKGYLFDPATGTLEFKSAISDSVYVEYMRFPEFLTKDYTIYDKSRIVANEAGETLYQVQRDAIRRFVPFEGLNTSGSITRGVTIGNNQNAVVNSTLDLQITGKLSDRVSLRASIQDTNIPLQEGGYSQRLDEFDQIFIELFSEKWSIRAGDLFLENRTSRFMNFNKKVQGVSAGFTFGGPDKLTKIFTAAALVRGQYARSTFTGQEGNQGPYKLRGPNNELYVLVISGSERVYVNGILLKRGENNDYVIDYNAGEITFTSLFPITSEMRINIEYQFSDRNYTRFITNAGVVHERKTWSIGGYVYSENDIKNQPLQQNLTPEQAQVLASAGDDTGAMVAPSAFIDTYSDNKILYRKIVGGGVEVFEYSNDPTLELYNVRFTLVGNNLGNYVLASTSAIGRIYQYVPPANGVPQGNYEPVTRLVPPTKIQIATVMGKVAPSEKSSVDFEAAISNNDLNLFSNADDNNNRGFAGSVNGRQRLLTQRHWKTDAFAQFQFVQQDFRTIERLYNIEFSRDWNLTSFSGNQSLLVSGVQTDFNPADSTGSWRGFTRYQFEKLDFSESFSGSRHVLDAKLGSKNITVTSRSSYLKSDGTVATSEFARSTSQARYHFGKNWIGGSFNFEDNAERLKATGQLTGLSQRFAEFGGFLGRGDSTRVYAEIGYLKRRNDSLQDGILRRVNVSDSYYLRSRLMQTENRNLSVFVNYRTLRFMDVARGTEPSLNSRVLYNDRYFGQKVALGVSYETLSGTIAQQEFTYLEVEPGQGVYTWNDYNANGIQELEEFEIAPFPDQAKYVRVFLPNQVFVKTHQNRFSTALTLNPADWQNSSGWKKTASYFYNQTSFLIDRKIRRINDNFDLNPFNTSADDLLGLSSAIRNSLFYNRGKQDHSVTYTYLINRARSLLSVGLQESSNESHQLQYINLFGKSWLLNLSGRTLHATLTSENFAQRNFRITGWQSMPKLSYLFSKNASWDIFYEHQQKENQIGLAERLEQHRVGTSFTFAGTKNLTMNGEFSLYQNRFTGDPLSPVAFQMLEGLLPGENLTWRLLVQKNLTEYLDINLNYQGRKSETSQAIHTGSVQLRAYF